MSPRPDWQRARCEMEEQRISWARKQMQTGARPRCTAYELRIEARKYAANSCRLALAQQR